MNHLAPSQHPLNEPVAKRWSPRAFSDKDVSDSDLGSLFEAARWASSCFNEQPWRFIIGRRATEAYDKILKCLVPSNQDWAQRAPVLMISVSRKHFTHNGKPNRHADYDTGQAAANLAIQAASMDLYIHQMGGFDAALAAETFHVPEEYNVLAAIAVGHAGDASLLSDGLQERELAERARKPLSELFFVGDWGKPFV